MIVIVLVVLMRLMTLFSPLLRTMLLVADLVAHGLMALTLPGTNVFRLVFA